MSDAGALRSYFIIDSIFPKHDIVGNGTHVPVTAQGHVSLPNCFHLYNTLIVPSFVKNLISVRQFTKDNSCSVEVDPLGFDVKDLRTQAVILHCNSSGDLYPFTASPPASDFSLTVIVASIPVSRCLWYQRLGYPSDPALTILASKSLISFALKTLLGIFVMPASLASIIVFLFLLQVPCLLFCLN